MPGLRKSLGRLPDDIFKDLKKPEGTQEKPSPSGEPKAAMFTAMRIIKTTRKGPNAAVVAAMTATTGHPLQNSFILDTGADVHVCSDLSRFKNLRSVDDQDLYVGDNLVPIKGYGEVDIEGKTSKGKPALIELREVAYVPNFNINVLSYYRARQAGFYLQEPQCRIVNKKQHEICQLQTMHRLMVVEYKETGPNTAFSARKSMEPRHVGHQPIEHLEECAQGVKVTPSPEPTRIYKVCRLTKSFQQISRRPREVVNKPGYAIHMDIIHMEEGFNDDRYIVHYACRATGFHWIYTTKTKSAAIKTFQHLHHRLKKQDIEITKLFSDHDTSFGPEHREFCRVHCIDHEMSAPYASQQNSFIERAGGVIILRIRALINAARVPFKFWPVVAETVAHLANYTPTRSKGEKWTTPYENWTGKKPDLSNLRVLGCRAFVRDPRVPKSDKIAPRAWIGYLVGYTASNIWKGRHVR
ncbi:integrase catalytic core [Aspergillus terreus]|uniref:Integrase catalytic core n=1 Tax=Aspergillus terreus TaxID=33178 RepID=A0A5M3Z844_ASPTE|nr:hypothetical protein ATETN484_0011034300 [Aspergillus terreus]GFF18985.1 integrase catalytic core [Aspergillus terreus]